jgi:hypothetical protein
MTIPVGYAQVTVEYGGTAAPTGAANVFGVRLDDALDAPLNVCTTVESVWVARVMPRLTDDVTLSLVRCKFGPDDTGPFAELSSGSAGGQAHNTQPANVAYLVGKATGTGGRRGRGRMFLPGVSETNVNDAGVLDSTWVTNWNTALALVLTDLDSAGNPMVVLHEPSTVWVLDANGQPKRQPLPGPLPSPDEVTSLSMSGRVATQRRRIRR